MRFRKFFLQICLQCGRLRFNLMPLLFACERIVPLLVANYIETHSEQQQHNLVKSEANENTPKQVLLTPR